MQPVGLLGEGHWAAPTGPQLASLSYLSDLGFFLPFMSPPADCFLQAGSYDSQTTRTLHHMLPSQSILVPHDACHLVIKYL